MQYQINVSGNLEAKSIDDISNRFYNDLIDFGLKIDSKESFKFSNNKKILTLYEEIKDIQYIILYAKFNEIDVSISFEQKNPTVKYNITAKYQGDIKKAEFVDNLAKILEQYR